MTSTPVKSSELGQVLIQCGFNRKAVPDSTDDLYFDKASGLSYALPSNPSTRISAAMILSCRQMLDFGGILTGEEFDRRLRRITMPVVPQQA